MRNGVLLLLLVAFGSVGAFCQPKLPADFYAGNRTIQDAVQKYHARYLSDFGTYAKDNLYGAQAREGSIYECGQDVADGLVRTILKNRGDYYAFKVEQNFGISKKKDKVAFIDKVKDQFDLLKIMGIQGNDFEISNAQVIGWFSKWDKEFKYQIIGIGLDFIQADILSRPANYLKLAKEIYSMCPDVVDQGTETVENLAKEMEKSKTMYFWWD